MTTANANTDPDTSAAQARGNLSPSPGSGNPPEARPVPEGRAIPSPSEPPLGQPQPDGHLLAEGTAARASGLRAVASRSVSRIMVWLQPLLRFFRKVSDDWVPLFTGMLTYRLLISSFSILLVIIAIGGLILGSISPAAQTAFIQRLAASLPMGNGEEVIGAVTTRLAQSAGILLLVSVALAAYTGSRLFIALERCFDIIFRVTGRRGLRSNLMAIGMLLLYTVLVPLVLMASILPATLLALLRSTQIAIVNSPVIGLLLQAAGILVSGLAAIVLFGAIYAIVPNRPLRPKEVWKGTLIAALLLLLDNALFPIYISVVLKPQNRGSIAGLLVVILAYYYFQAYILLLGAQINAWAYGFRRRIGSLDMVVEQAQTQVAAGTWRVPERQRHPAVVGDETMPLDESMVPI